jgi:hypothetical protein
MADKGSKDKSATASVLGSLPATRPERLGRPRRGAAAPASAKPNPARPRTARKPPAAPAPAPGAPGPAAVSPGSPPLECHARPESPPEATPIGAPRGTELVTTAIRATGELAQIGLSVGGRALKRAVTRLPHP